MSTGDKGWFKNLPDDELLRLGARRLDELEQINAAIEAEKLVLHKLKLRKNKLYERFKLVETNIIRKGLDK